MTKEQAIEVLHELDGCLYETQQVALDMAIKALEQQPSDDCVSRQAVIDLINADWKYEGLEVSINELPPVTPTHGTCKDCSHYDPLTCNSGTCLNPNMQWSNEVSATHYCADYEKRGNENDI